MTFFRRGVRLVIWAMTVVAVGILFLSCTSSEPWKAQNDEVIKQYNLTSRERVLPQLDVVSNLDVGNIYKGTDLPTIEIAPGVLARVAWGRGAMMEFVEMGPAATYPQEVMGGEVITLVQEGSAICVLGEEEFELGKDTVLYLTQGMKRSLKAGPDGWKAIEVFSPVRIDHLNLAGVELSENAKVTFDEGVTANLEPAKVYHLNSIQFTPLTDPDKSRSYYRTEANSRLLWGKNVQLSYIRMDPNSSFSMHLHPEDQLMTTLRGGLEQSVMDSSYALDGAHQTLFIPGGMTHAAKLGEFGADALDVFWPVRPDYVDKARKQSALYLEVIPAGAEPKKLADGFTFGEGITWLKGKLYFSDMFFQDPAQGDWTGDPKRSRLIRMEVDGTWKVLSMGMQSNGTIASRRGNLLVCDMFGHRVIEVSPNNGRVLKTVLSRVNGKRVDGPNDLVMDAKGGIYVTDPQFTPEEKKNQPGTQVYYVPPSGRAKMVIPAGEYAFPNGVEISPDGKTLYVNNTWLKPGKNFVWAYDVQEDGSLTNKRKFAMLNLTPEVLSAEDPAKRFDSIADGMAVDLAGRLYVTTQSGVQIFDERGVYVGTIWVPESPINICFGGPNYDKLYMVSQTAVWVIQTKVKGFRHPEGLI